MATRKPYATLEAILEELSRVGREHSDATVLFHAILASQLNLHPTDSDRSFQGSHVDDKAVTNVAEDLEMSMTRHNSLLSKRVLTEPFGVPLRAVEARAGLVKLVLAFQGGGPGALQKARNLGLRKRLEGADGFEGLVEDLLTTERGRRNAPGSLASRGRTASATSSPTSSYEPAARRAPQRGSSATLKAAKAEARPGRHRHEPRPPWIRRP